MQSRYYNPNIGKFINADAYTSTGQGMLGNNMFAYCRNNPVCRKDAFGTEDVTAYMDDGSDGDIDCAPIDPDDVYKNGSTGNQNVGQNTGSGGGGGNGNPGTPGGGNGNPGTPGGGQYQPPAGGGGITNTVNVNGTTVDFGHGGRHVDGVSIADLENAIANDVVNRPPSYGNATSVDDFMYAGQTLHYSYYTREPSHINVGTYYFMEQLR